jgi:hypothetical protein
VLNARAFPLFPMVARLDSPTRTEREAVVKTALNEPAQSATKSAADA